ncbi:MAG: NTP transferase domain-containing protein [Prevotella sp.]|jgi:mannose-1-phosphate guanylyltransferase|nr:NTP transferase domain-containing protein [Prevotella sp.]MCH4212149.1 NTP transferase domain-containing protein [Prevotella sp.]MCH4241135.1 NTP transferase domain-containing protein [Prevotella sp.]
MAKTDENYCVILAGGRGKRLWPCSREQQPKQFIDFFGTGKTQFQQTYDRISKFIEPSHIYVNTNEQYVGMVKNQLPDLPDDNLLAEPINRNTAPSVAWACCRISHINPQANLIIVPSDQTIINEEAFQKNVLDGLQFVSDRDCLLAMGVKPTRPEPGYGYIQIGDSSDHSNFYKVHTFIEKPDRSFAKMFMDSGEWYWNTGIFLANLHALQGSLAKLLPGVLQDLDRTDHNITIPEENAYIKEHFSFYPNLAIDTGLLEKTDNVYVKKCDFGWADLGTWHSIYEFMQKGKKDNVVIDSDVMMEDCRDNIIKLPKGRMAVLNGLDGFIIAEKDNVLFICKKEDSSALIRKYVNVVQMKRGDQYI